MDEGGSDNVRPGGWYPMRHSTGASLEMQCMSSAFQMHFVTNPWTPDVPSLQRMQY